VLALQFGLQLIENFNDFDDIVFPAPGSLPGLHYSWIPPFYNFDHTLFGPLRLIGVFVQISNSCAPTWHTLIFDLQISHKRLSPTQPLPIDRIVQKQHRKQHVSSAQ
jgi:hypothetical protein